MVKNTQKLVNIVYERPLRGENSMNFLDLFATQYGLVHWVVEFPTWIPKISPLLPWASTNIENLNFLSESVNYQMNSK